ncbi:SMC-Scp complex subunit ScpB [Actinoplanes sp. NPDC049548]|uniref:SMC-Scp complex subunit ScpB n=1 Tax=Actinoplanes sp. NPDC049548 TaxID=3155152 RepID=UPI00343C692F
MPPELPPVPGEVEGPATVDAPQELPGEDELDPTDIGLGPELPVPDAIEEASENEIGSSPLVDAPLPEDGDDAGDVFDHAADDDLTDDAEADLPVVEEVPGPDVNDGAAAEGEAGAGGSGIPAQGRRGRAGGAASAESSARTEEEVELKPLDDGELRAALEAILLVVDEPVAEMQLAQIVEQPTERVAAMLEDISARYTAAGHGFDLRRAAGGWRLYTRPEYAPYVERFVLDGQSVRLTQAALETLAVVAYKQPVTRSRISAIRGVNCDGVMRTLVTRGLIEECGTEGETGAFLYRTTALFLEKLGLNSVDQLPPLAPFLPDDVEEVLDASG